MSRDGQKTGYQWRRRFVLSVLGASVLVLGWRLLDLQVLDRDFYRGQGDARILRVTSVPAHRGMITDRNGEPMAVSTPVASLWANPQELIPARDRWSELARALGLKRDELERDLSDYAQREFMYLKRQVPPDVAEAVKALDIPGVYLTKEYRRYYPAGEVTAHVLGFTDVDDRGQEGIELAYDDWLRGIPGSKRVIKDGRRQTVQDVESIREPRPGRDLKLSIDLRLQYLAYRELKATVQEHQARSGSLVLLDARTGEVLAMVNQPAGNPNNRADFSGSRYRNRAVTDPFEPGSTVKPFTVAAALEEGTYTPETPVETGPGWLRVGRNTVRDVHNYGSLDVSGVIKKSSNVGVAKIALSLPPERLWGVFSRVGFGKTTGSGFPGETGGLLADYTRWRPIEQATFAFGYGVSVTALQLAEAYTVLANGGVRHPVSMLRRDEVPEGERVLSEKVVSQILPMLQSVVEKGGTATRAAIPGYRVGGKTGTVRKVTAGGYSTNHYLALFSGIAPLSHPRLVMAVMINDPGGRSYYGGQVAAPLFANVMSGALRLLNIPPDAPTEEQLRLAGNVKVTP